MAATPWERRAGAEPLTSGLFHLPADQRPERYLAPLDELDSGVEGVLHGGEVDRAQLGRKRGEHHLGERELPAQLLEEAHERRALIGPLDPLEARREDGLLVRRL